MKIAIYSDYVFNNTAIYRRAQERGHMVIITAPDVLNNWLERENPDILIMPGGADLFYCDKLNGAGNRNIQRYVENGGTYLGLCAGAYYGSAALKWLDNTKSEISGKRELSFTNLCAEGPISAFLDGAPETHWEQGRVVNVKLQNEMLCPVYYCAGPLFTGEDNDVEILARYADLPGNPASIITKNLGRGRVILSGVHFEVLAEDITMKMADVPGYEFSLPKDEVDRLSSAKNRIRDLNDMIFTHLIA